MPVYQNITSKVSETLVDTAYCDICAMINGLAGSEGKAVVCPKTITSTKYGQSEE